MIMEKLLQEKLYQDTKEERIIEEVQDLVNELLDELNYEINSMLTDEQKKVVGDIEITYSV